MAIHLAFTFTLKMLYGIIAQLLQNKHYLLDLGTFLVLLLALFSGRIVYHYVILFAWPLRALLINK